MNEQERKDLRDDLLKRARLVATASGSFLGLTSGISKSEARVLEELATAFA
jgi:hypothetical protein